MRAPRGFTLLEMTIVLSIATVLTMLGLISATEIIREARFRSDRARLYLDIKEIRDRAGSTMETMVVRAASTSAQQFEFYTRVVNGGCSNAVWPSGPLPLGGVVRTYPGLGNDNLAGAGPDAICIDGTKGISAAADGLLMLPVVALPFGRAGATLTEEVRVKEDGRLEDSWNEFADEGVYEAASCDIDTDPNCGEVL